MQTYNKNEAVMTLTNTHLHHPPSSHTLTPALHPFFPPIEYRVVPVALSALTGLSAVRLNLPKDLAKDSARKGVLKAKNEVLRRFQEEGVPELDPVTDMGVTNEAFIRYNILIIIIIIIIIINLW